MDEDFLYALMDFAKFDVQGWRGLESPDGDESGLYDTNLSTPKPQSYDGDVRMYFESFLLQPVKFNLTFTRTTKLKRSAEEKSRPQSHNIFTFVFDVFSMAMGNIHDAPIKMNALELDHPIITFRQLSSLVQHFYSQEIVGQVYHIYFIKPSFLQLFFDCRFIKLSDQLMS